MSVVTDCINADSRCPVYLELKVRDMNLYTRYLQFLHMGVQNRNTLLSEIARVKSQIRNLKTIQCSDLQDVYTNILKLEDQASLLKTQQLASILGSKTYLFKYFSRKSLSSAALDYNDIFHHIFDDYFIRKLISNWQSLSTRTQIQTMRYSFPKYESFFNIFKLLVYMI